jgi:prepilin-type N-terminal cleavage/methylation domain-containing protein
MTCARQTHFAARGFSLVEVVIVVAIVGVIAAIAVPRMSSAAARARATSLRADVAAMNRAVEFYIAEHGGLHPGQDKSGAVTADASALAGRLVDRTDPFGDPGTVFGPYLMRIPPNPFNGLATVRIDGAPAGAGTHGWRYDSARRVFRADDSVATAAITGDSVTAVAVEKDAGGETKFLGGDAMLVDDGK